MASSLSASMLASFQQRADVYVVFELTLPNTSAGTTTHKFTRAEAALAVGGEGHYIPAITSIGEVWLELGFPSFGLPEPRVTLTLNDSTRTLQQAIAGPARGRVRGSVAKAYLASGFAPWADKYPIMDGLVKDYHPTERGFSFTVGPDDRQLRENNLSIPTLEEEFESLPDENVGLPGRFVLGRHLSPGVPNANGMVTAHLIDPVGGWWYISHGQITSTPTIWVKASGSDVFAADSDFTLLTTFATKTGRNASVLQDNASTKRTVDDVVQVDVIGPSLDWDGTGGAYNSPGQFAFDALANFAWNEYPRGRGGSNEKFDETGSPDGNAAPLDSVGFALADTVLGYGNVTASMVLTGEITGQQMLEAWAETFQVPIGWNDEFKLTAQPIDLGQRDYPTVSARYDRGDFVKLHPPRPLGDDELTRVEVSYLRNSTSGSLVRSHVAADAAAPRRISGSFSMEYGPAEAIT